MNVDRMRKYAIRNYPDTVRFTLNMDDPWSDQKAKDFYDNFCRKMRAKHGMVPGAKIQAWTLHNDPHNPTYLLVYREK